MAPTRDFKSTIQARSATQLSDESFSVKASNACLPAEVDIGKTVLGDYINATVGFNDLAEVVHCSPKSLMRMLGSRGNPQARNLFKIVAYLMRHEGIRLELRTTAVRA